MALSAGCICYPDDRVQALCCQHLDRSTPLGDIDVIVHSASCSSDGAAYSKRSLPDATTRRS